MKVKLLKIVRKRFEIQYCPNGGFIWGDWTSKPHFLFIDHYDSWSSFPQYIEEGETKEMVENNLYQYLVKTIRRKYIKHGKRRIQKAKQTTVKYWWK